EPSPCTTWSTECATAWWRPSGTWRPGAASRDRRPAMPMSGRPVPGTPVTELTTPCLVVDLDALQHNIAVVARQYRDTAVKLRPHVKNHKCPQIAHLQLSAGGTVGGVCAAKVAEAEIMVEAGIRSVLVANQVVTPGKIRRLASLARRADVIVAVDDA